VCICGCMMGKLSTESELPSQLLTRRDWSTDYGESNPPLLGYMKLNLSFRSGSRYVITTIPRDKDKGWEELVASLGGTYCVNETTGQVTLKDDRPHIPLAVGEIEKSGKQLQIQFKPDAEKVTFKQKSRFIW